MLAQGSLNKCVLTLEGMGGGEGTGQVDSLFDYFKVFCRDVDIFSRTSY